MPQLFKVITAIFLVAGAPVQAATVAVIGTDDAAAKARVAELVREPGLEALEVGPARYVRSRVC